MEEKEMKYISWVVTGRNLDDLDEKLSQVLKSVNSSKGEVVSISHCTQPTYSALLILKMPASK